MIREDTIAAISSAVGSGGISVIRVSGTQAFALTDRIFRGKKRITQAESHTILYGKIVDGEQVVDEVLVMVMRAPKTYTCEDVVEIDCHGGVLVTKKILELLVRQGIRIAQPGEFTKRAFLNGRIDLSQAEAVMDVIDAKSEQALQGAVLALKGNIQQTVVKLRSQIIEDIARMEAAMDDPEHMSVDDDLELLHQNVQEQITRLKSIEEHADSGRMIREGIWTVILGKPNVGKSSLLNALLGEERAIVTDVEGTTRDTLEETVNFDGVLLKLVDTAGIHETEDKVEQIGVERSSAAAKNADLVLHVIDGSVPLTKEDLDIFELAKDKKGLILLNKTDLAAVVDRKEIRRYSDKDLIEISAKQGEGLKQLHDKILEMFYQGEIDFNEEIYLSNLRQKEAVHRALEALLLVDQGFEQQIPIDLLTIDWMSAYEYLGDVIGESLRDDLADTIFSKFCMGK